MTRVFLARPDSPLVFRTGRPFGAADSGGGGQSHAFPMPGTTAGALRSAWVDASGHEPRPNDPVLDHIHVRGPLRCTVSEDASAQLWLPVPADAVCTVPVQLRQRVQLLRLTTAAREADAGCDLPFGLQHLKPPREGEVEPAKGSWGLPAVARWLSREAPLVQAVLRGQMPPPKSDRRIHVAIDQPEQQARDKALFFSEGLDFTPPAAEAASDHGLLLCVEGDDSTMPGFDALASRHGRVGADTRTAAYVELAAERLPGCPDALVRELLATEVGDVVRLYLATPACYLRNGWYPDGLRHDRASGSLRGSLPGLPGWVFELQAAAVGRFTAHGGASMRGPDGSSGHSRKPLRRLVPAGSVYWLKVLERAAEARPLHERWLQSTCRVEFARDGYGLGLWGRA